MKRLRNIISTKMKKEVSNSFQTFAFLILFLSLNVSVSAEEPAWKEYSLRELIGRLKYYTYAKVAQSLRREYPASQEQVWENSPCSISLPELPGPFFCGLLKQQSSSAQTSASTSEVVSTPSSLSASNTTTASANSPSSTRGLNPNPAPVKEYKNIQLYSGSTISGKNVAQIGSEESPGESLRAFYLNNGQLSHYEFQDRILIFDWSGSKLNAILEVKVDPILRPLSGREILFP